MHIIIFMFNVGQGVSKPKLKVNAFNICSDCVNSLSPDDLCPWSPWSVCSRSCGAGSVTRRRVCVCDERGEVACPPEIEAERSGEENQLCYKQPCPGT